ncbi:uncharacterized protein [Dysidea avara]|uniref:uncharacterized protein isoform X3 n=1 Tax=Dysidea avara TaxID=196820 RepID=UPI0033344A6D
MSSKSASQFKPKEGILQIKSNHKWVSYNFKTSGVYFHYFKSGRLVGQVFKHEIKEVTPSTRNHKGAAHCFEVHYSGSGSPWILSASTQEDCKRWMECLQQGSSNKLKISQTPNSFLSLPSPQSPPIWSGSNPGLYNANDPPFQNTTLNSSHDGFVRRHSYSGSYVHDNDSVMLQPNPTMSQHGQNCSQSVPVGVTREQFMQENQPERHFLNVDSHHSSFQPLERTGRLHSGNQQKLPPGKRYTVSTGAIPQHVGSGYNFNPANTTYDHMHSNKILKEAYQCKQFQSNDDSEYLYMAKGNSPTAAEIIEQTKHHDTQRSKAGGYQSRLSDSQLSPPPPTLQPNGDGYEYMAKGVGPMFNHQTLISEDSHSQPPPLPTKPHDGDYDKFHYFSTEQVHMLADMFTQMVKIKEGASFPEHPDNKTSAPIDLDTVLKRSSMVISDQILCENRQSTVVGEDHYNHKWAHASFIPNATPLDNLAESITDIDPLFKEALTISKDSLSDFTNIGKGQYGEVLSALYRPSPGSVSIKVAVKKTKEGCSSREKENFLKEIIVMAQFMHPNIVRVFGSVDEGTPSPWLVLEYLSNGDLKTFLKNNNRPVHRLVKYMVDVAMGMHYLSEKGFVHRDLAARNIFMDENELCKVGDFGLLRETTKHEDSEDELYVMKSSLALPIRWMAVESITDQIFTSASDVWSFGVLMWELFNPSVKPYEPLKNVAVIAEVSAGKRLDIPMECPKMVGDLMQACWITDYTKRPSFLVIANLLCRCIQEKPTPTITYQYL